jgi:uncharacterized protein (UPF0297 family)
VWSVGGSLTKTPISFSTKKFTAGRDLVRSVERLQFLEELIYFYLIVKCR